MVSFPQEQTKFRQIGHFGLSVPQGSILQSGDVQTQSRICLLSLMSVLQGHTGDLLTVLDCIQNVQITTVGLNGTCRAFEGSLLHSSHCCSCDLEMGTWVVRHASWPGHPWKGICIYVCPSGSVVQPEILVCQAANPVMTGCIQLGCCKHVGQGIIVCIHIKGQPIQVVRDFFDSHLLEGEKLQLVCWVVRRSLAQAPSGIGYYSICVILIGLVENNSQTRPTGISVELERLGDICIGKNRCSGTQSFKVIKGLLTSAVPLDGSLFLVSILTPKLTCARVGLPVWI